MSHTRYNVERDLVDFWGRLVYDNVVNQPNYTNKYKNTTKLITQSIIKAIDSNKNVSIDTPTFQGMGEQNTTTPHNRFCIDGQFVTITTTTKNNVLFH